MKEQEIWTTNKKCPYSCKFCYNGGEFKELEIPEIKSNNVKILDPAFLSREGVLVDIMELGQKRVNGKVVYYQLVQGINYKDITQEITNNLKSARFRNIRIAWDWQYNRKYMFKIYDALKLLYAAGYKPKDIMIYILVNWTIPYEDCIKKLDLIKYWGCQVCDCCYDGGHHIKNEIDYNNHQHPKNWKYKDLKYFRAKCRKHNQIVKRGIDPEVK